MLKRTPAAGYQAAAGAGCHRLIVSSKCAINSNRYAAAFRKHEKCKVVHLPFSRMCGKVNITDKKSL